MIKLRRRLMMIEPKEFVINKDVTISDLVKNGFVKYEYMYVYKKCLYYHDGTKNPYVMLKMIAYLDGEPYLMYNITCDDGCCYPAFYDPTIRHNNVVYEKVVNTYNNIIDRFVKNNILKYRER